MPRIATPKPRIKQQVYAALPLRLLLHPPIRHRHHDDTERLTPFEFANACSLIGMARQAVLEDLNDQSYKSGGEAITEEKEYATDYRRKVQANIRARKRARRTGDDPKKIPVPQRQHSFDAVVIYARENERREEWGLRGNRNARRPINRKLTMQFAGREGYKRKRDMLRHRQVMAVNIEVSRYAILRAIGWPDEGSALRRVDAAIARLMKPVGGVPPLIRQAQNRDDGHWLLQIDGAWLDPPFEKVPLPMPWRSEGALAAYLFIHALDLGLSNRRDIDERKLAERLGLPLNRRNTGKLLKKTLEIMNWHLVALHKSKAAELDELGIDLRATVNLAVGTAPGRVRLTTKDSEAPKPVKRAALTPEQIERQKVRQFARSLPAADEREQIRKRDMAAFRRTGAYLDIPGEE